MSDEADIISAAVNETESAAENNAEETVTPASQETQEAETQTQTETPAVPSFGLDSALPPEIAARYPGVKNLGDFEKKYRSSSGEARRIASENAELKRQLEALQRGGQPQQPQQQAPNAGGSYFGFRDAQEYAEALKKDPIGAAKKFEEYMIGRAQEAYEKKIQEKFAPLEQREQKMMFDNDRAEAFKNYSEFGPGQPWHDMTAAFLEANPELGNALHGMLGKVPVNVHEIAGKLATYDVLKAQLATLKGERLEKGKRAGAVGKPSVGAPTTPKKDTVKDALRHAAAKDGVDQDDADRFAETLDRI